MSTIFITQRIADFGALPCLWKLLSKKVEEMEVWRTIASITKWNNRRIKVSLQDLKGQLNIIRSCIHCLHVLTDFANVEVVKSINMRVK